MAGFDLTSKNFEKSETDFHTNWFSDETIGVRTRFQRLSFIPSFLRTAGFTKLTKCALYIVAKSIKHLWIDIFDSWWQNFVKKDHVFCTKETLWNRWNKVRRRRWWLEGGWSERLGERSNGFECPTVHESILWMFIRLEFQIIDWIIHCGFAELSRLRALKIHLTKF